MSKKLYTSELLRRVDAGDSFAEIASDYGISRQAVQKRIRKLRGQTTKAIAVRDEKVNRVVDQKLDAVDQLQKINDHANELLDLCMAWGRGDDEALQILESQRTARTVRIGDEEIDVQQFKFKDPRELALKAMAEIRGQLKLQLEIFQALYDLKAAQEFQEEVLSAIGEVSPDVRKQIIHKLNQKSAIRSAVRFS
jgi:DNA-binding Lrp family transcriptional regulator